MKADAKITKSEFNLFECGINYWKSLTIVKEGTRMNGVIRITEKGEKYEAIKQKRNTVYIQRSYR